MTRIVSGGAISASLTYDCDIYCRYCLRDAGPTKLETSAGEGEMPFDLFAEIVAHARAVGYDKIGLTGGEVTRYPHLFDALHVLDRLGYSVLIETNGNHRNTALIDEILRACSRISFSVSLDGPTPDAHDALRGRGTWQAAVDTIRYMISRGVGVMMNAVVTPFSFNTEREIVEHVAFAKKLGVWRLVFSRVVDSGRGIEQAKWQIYPQKKLWLREILGKHGMWDGFVGHLFHYRDSRPHGGSEHMMSCYRLEEREISMSPNGFHTCCFLHGIVVAPLTAYREYIGSNAPLAFNHLRSAAMVESADSHAVYSCAECTIDYRRYVEAVQTYKISDVEIRPHDRRFKQELLEDPHARYTRPFPAPEALHVAVRAPDGGEIDVALLDKLLVEAQFIGVRDVVYTGAEPLAHQRFASLLELPERYGQRASFVTGEDLWFERRALFEAHRDAVQRLWFEGAPEAMRDARERGFSVAEGLPPPGARAAYVDRRGRFHPSPAGVDREGDARLPSIHDQSLYECLADIHALGAAAPAPRLAAEPARPASKRDGQMRLKIVY